MSKFVFLIMCIDNILHATNDLDLLYKTKKFLFGNFEIKDIEEITYVIKIKIF
jgi:hypothetical protein